MRSFRGWFSVFRVAIFASSTRQPKGIPMDKDRLEGIGHQLKGAVKEGLGAVLGDAKLQAEGIAERAAGKVQNAVGSAKDVARDGIDAVQDDFDK
jgi:uncharacterized protein YjbJ (UPF0337 family)